MANREQLNILKQGVDAWNQYRQTHRHGAVDLSRADLGGADLRGAYLSGANLRGANLSRADLRSAYLYGTALTGALLNSVAGAGVCLQHANLQGAHLRSCNLFDADLSGADLRAADLVGSDLRQARLSQTLVAGADFSLVRLGGTFFTDVDLSGAKHLDQCRHDAPSTLDHRTLERSLGLPATFLRGVELDEGAAQRYLHGTAITIEFREAVWGQLFPLEQALVTTLGQDYIIEKDASKIVVRLESKRFIQRAFDGIAPALAGLAAVVPEEVQRVEVRPSQQERHAVEGEALRELLLGLNQILGQMQHGIDAIGARVHGVDVQVREIDARGREQARRAEAEPDLGQKMVLEVVRGAPVPSFISNPLAALLEAGMKKANAERIRAAYEGLARGARGVTELPEDAAHKQLGEGTPRGATHDAASG